MLAAFSNIESIVASISPAGKAFVEQFCPSLAIFGCATETAVFAKAAYDCNKERSAVKKELQREKQPKCFEEIPASQIQ
jgi:hypothetical protein